MLWSSNLGLERKNKRIVCRGIFREIYRWNEVRKENLGGGVQAWRRSWIPMLWSNVRICPGDLEFEAKQDLPSLRSGNFLNHLDI
jgi:hypothetical protein